jgi:hypothetical protein
MEETATLLKSGFSGITFSVRDDIKFGVRAIPYYQYDGPVEELEVIKSQLFQLGIPASLARTKLRVSGTSNCVVLADILGINNEWTTALKEYFLTGKYRTEVGIKELFLKFGTRSTITFNDICNNIDIYKTRMSSNLQQTVMSRVKSLKLLPKHDGLYRKYDISSLMCQQCSHTPVDIYFVGKYPQEFNLIFLCKPCVEFIKINWAEQKRVRKFQRKLTESVHMYIGHP